MALRSPMPLTLVAMLGAALVPAGPATGQARPGFDGAWRALDAWFRSSVEAEGIVGGSLILVRGDSIVARAHQGYADLATRRPVDDRTIYHWASVTKTFTAVALAQLVERGRARFEDPAVRHVPELARVHNPHGPIEAVTLRHLLSHSAGFRNPTWPWGGGEPWHPFEPTEWAQLVAMLPYTDVRFPPGSRYSYSNPGLIFVGRTIEALTGDDYEVYVHKNLLAPLGMASSYFDVTPYHLLAHRSNNWEVRDGERVENGLDFDTGITVSNGGLNASMADMARYLAFLLGSGSAARGPVPVLGRATLEAMWRPLLPAAAGETSGDSVATGFFVRHLQGVRLIGHTGSQRGFRSFIYVDPASGLGVAAAFNTAAAAERPGVRPDIARLREELLLRLTRDLWPAARR